MKFEIPAPLTVEHHHLQMQLVKATEEPSAVGDAAREVARLLHPHFVLEEEFALPPLGISQVLATQTDPVLGSNCHDAHGVMEQQE